MAAAATLMIRAHNRLLPRTVSRLTLHQPVCSLRNGFRPHIPACASLARFYASGSFPPHTMITMPALSPTMTAGNVGAWQKNVGDKLVPGDVLVEIETDKAQMDFEFQEEGVLAKILKDSGEKDVPIGQPIAVMVEEGTELAPFESFTLADAESAIPSPKPAEESKPAEPAQPAAEAAPAADEAPSAVEPETSVDRLQPALDREPLIAPAVRALAIEKGVPIKDIKGTGSGGRITKEDVEKYEPPVISSVVGPSYEDIPVSSMRGTIAKRLLQSTQQNPTYFVSSSLSVTKLLKLRQALNASSDGAYKLSVNDFLIKALALALLKVPPANSSWLEENGKVTIRRHNTADISVAVATPSGLITPIVRSVEKLGLVTISNQVKDMSKRARDNKLKPEEYLGGTFSISNMGMNDAVDRFTAIINPPQAGILAIGTTQKVAVPAETDEGTSVEWDEKIVITGSFDHKVVDGAVGAEFMRELKKIVENPLDLLL